MADELNDVHRIQVHQALHGYSDGHRLLACSTMLKPKEQKTMLIMSDVSGSGAVIPKAGYLTGYPLPESRLYALARTWPASELPRPGCVWTHTLLLDFSDLALLPALGVIEAVFRRPQGVEQIGYDSAITLEETQLISTPRVDNDENRESLRQLLWALYERPKERIVADESSSSEQLVIALWSQQWPRLRRTFRFCTLTFADRSGEGASFDLQFLPPRETSVRSRFSTATDASRLRAAPAEWLDDALLDLSQGTAGRLRSFLRQAGGDVAGGREAFVPLCRLHRLVNDFAVNPDAVDATIMLLEHTFDTESAKTARSIVTSTAASRPEALSDHALAFVMQHLDLLARDQLGSVGERLAAELWSRDPDLLIGLLGKEPNQRVIAERLLAKLPTNDLAESLHQASNVSQQVLGIRPDLVTVPEFWTLDNAWQALGILVAAEEPERSQAALAAMLVGNRSDLISPALRAFGCAQLLRAIDRWLSEKGVENQNSSISSWLDATLTDPAELAKALSTQVVRDRATLCIIARRTNPDFVPNEFGEDPWWTAVRESKGKLSDGSLQYLSAYLLSRGLGRRSRNTGELLAFAFDSVYSVALKSQLMDEAWRLMEPRLPWLIWGFDWDHCRRIRVAVVDAFLDRDLSPVSFGQITGNDDLFAELAELMAYSRRGRRFLRMVRDALKEVPSDRFRQRVHTIQALV
jgi:GTPase-associated protein 1